MAGKECLRRHPAEEAGCISAIIEVLFTALRRKCKSSHPVILDFTKYYGG
jgi:hypothetical protein